VRYLGRILFEVCIEPMIKAGGYVKEIWESRRCRRIQRALIDAQNELALAIRDAGENRKDAAERAAACVAGAIWAAEIAPLPGPWHGWLEALGCLAGAAGLPTEGPGTSGDKGGGGKGDGFDVGDWKGGVLPWFSYENDLFAYQSSFFPAFS